jgi:hypothetical protein
MTGKPFHYRPVPDASKPMSSFSEALHQKLFSVFPD